MLRKRSNHAIFVLFVSSWLSVVHSQEGHPLTGTWTGDWRLGTTDVRHVTVALDWDGKNITGTINPGPNASRVRNVTVDVASWTVRIEASGKESITVDGRIANIGSANRTLTGTWTEGSSRSAITLSRVDSLSVSSGGSASIEPIYSGSRVTLKGVVTNVEWINPRAFISLDNWRIDIGGAIELERSGWTRRSINVGDTVTVQGIAASGSERQARATSVLSSRGTRLFVPKTPAPAASAPAPRWPDGQIRLGPPVGAKGYWAAATPNPANEKAGLAVAMPWAKAVYEYRQRTKLKDDPAARCVPPGGPRQFLGEQGFQFVDVRQRILVLLGDGDRNWRIIYTDGRPQGQPADVVSSYYGSSVGHWDKDTLVVDSVGYNEKFWFMSGGLPHTEALHLTEAFTRADMSTLKYDVTVDDPRTYTKPWSVSWTMRWVPDQEIQEFFCEEKTS
jgi:hypothetical protein